MKRVISLLLVFCIASGLLLIRLNGITAYAQDNFEWTKKDIDQTCYYDIAYGNNLYVMVASDGSIRTSPDAKVWTKRVSPVNEWLSDIIWNGSIFVAIGRNGNMVTSQDGITWTDRAMGIGIMAGNFEDIIWDGKQFIVVGAGSTDETGLKGLILKSENGIDWSWVDAPKLNGITYNGKAYVAVGINGKAVFSSDGVSWEEKDTGSTAGFEKVTWDGQRFIAVGVYNQFTGSKDVIIVSTDGLAWNIVEPEAHCLYDVASHNGKTIAVGAGGILLSSTDGLNWKTEKLGYRTDFNGIVFQNGHFLIAGSNGRIYVSQDGTVWEDRSFGLLESFNSASWTGDKFLVTGERGTILISDDGILWDEKKVCPSNIDFYDAAFGAGMYVAVGKLSRGGITSDDGVIYISKDGTNWSEQKIIEGKGLRSVVYNGKVFLAAGYGPDILTSKDGIEWSQSKGPYGFSQVLLEGDKFFAVGGLGKFFVSTDGVSWKECLLYDQPIPSHTNSSSNAYNYSIYSIVYNGSVFTGVGLGIIATSSDGFTWEAKRRGSSENFKNVIWTGVQFVAINERGKCCTSPNALSWTTMDSVGKYALDDIVWNGSKIVAVGHEGTVLMGEQRGPVFTPAPIDVTITSPGDGSVLNFSTRQGPYIPTYYTIIPIEVSIKNNGKAIRKVEFYRNNALIGFSDKSPYSFSMSYALSYPGTTEELTAKVIYMDGTSGESIPSSVRINVSHIDDYSSPEPIVKTTPANSIRISGYIKPDHVHNQYGKYGFIIRIGGKSGSFSTDEDGFFEMYVPRGTDGCTLAINKPGYLERIITANSLEDIQIGTKDSPLELWAGDIVRDSAVNMRDIMEVAKCFNTAIGGGLYNSSMDYNQDNAINLVDIMIIAKNFNKTIDDYPNMF